MLKIEMMENDPLDAPISMQRVDLRDASVVMCERLFLYGNGTVMVVSWGVTVWAIVTQPELAGIFLFFAVLVNLCTYVPFKFLRCWQTASIAYHQDGDILHMKQMGVNGLSVPIFAIVLWMMYILMIILFGVMEGGMNNLLDFLWLLPGILLGPLQMLYFFQLTRLYDKVIAYHKVRGVD